MGYKKPLLIELFVEVDLATPIAGARLIDLALKLRSFGLSEVELAGHLNGTVTFPGAPFQARLRCWSEDRSRLVQLSHDQIVLNHVGEYLGWSRFAGLADQVLGAADSLVELVPSAVSLHAIDRLESTDPGFALGRYFSCDGRWIPQWYQDCKESCDVSLGRGLYPQDPFNRQVALQVRRLGANTSVQLATVFKQRLTEKSIGETLGKLHEESNRLFEELITDETRKYMGGT